MDLDTVARSRQRLLFAAKAAMVPYQPPGEPLGFLDRAAAEHVEVLAQEVTDAQAVEMVAQAMFAAAVRSGLEEGSYSDDGIDRNRYRIYGRVAVSVLRPNHA